MVVVVNKHGAPKTLENLYARDTYSRGRAQISVTQLIDSPRVSILRKKHDNEITVDIADMLWMLLGKALHHVAEAGADEQHIPEERMFLNIAGWTISGAVDVQVLDPDKPKVVRIVDYKFTSVYNVMHEKKDWVTQLNCYAYLIRKTTDYEIDGLRICAFLRDWRRNEIGKPGYPQAPIWPVDIDLWDEHKQEEYIRERIDLHQHAHATDMEGEPLPMCSAEERWARPTQYACIVPGNARATFVADSMASAQDWVANSKTPNKYVVEVREGEDIRCASYCTAAPWCEYAKKKGYPK